MNGRLILKKNNKLGLEVEPSCVDSSFLSYPNMKKLKLKKNFSSSFPQPTKVIHNRSKVIPTCARTCDCQAAFVTRKHAWFRQVMARHSWAQIWALQGGGVDKCG